MIGYMPFSYLSEDRLLRVIRLFRKVVVYAPGPFLVSEEMRRHMDTGELEARLPSAVDPARLRNVLQEFRGWAERIQPRTGDLANFFRSMEGRLPMMDETNPSQITTRIRRYGRHPETGGGDALFQAALFMAMAHEYDAQQDALSRELGSVEAVEQRMFDRLTGRPEEVDELFEGLKVEPLRGQPEESGLYMTEQRIEAWATLAASDPDPPWAYVTHSRAVWEGLMEKLPAMSLEARWTMGPRATATEMRADWLEAIETLAFGRGRLEGPPKLEAKGAASQFSLYVLSDCDPYRFCAILSGRPAGKPTAPPSPRPVNTVLGLLEASA